MGLQEYAPFLASLGPYVLVLPLFFMVAYLYLTRTEPRPKDPGFKPKDEDDYVFQDKSDQPPAHEGNYNWDGILVSLVVTKLHVCYQLGGAG